MTRSEILGLSKMSEREQEDFFYAHDISKYIERYDVSMGGDNTVLCYESLPDLADRLFGSGKGIRVSHMIEIYMAQTGNTAPDKDVEYALFWRWWAMDSKPIHRIQAALLAKEFQK